MSDKVTKMPVSQEPSETKSMTVAIDIDIDMSYRSDAGTWDKGTVYMVVTGIPIDLPVEYESTIIKAAEQQFASTLNNARWLEMYPREKSALDGETPTFISLRHVTQITIAKVRKFA